MLFAYFSALEDVFLGATRSVSEQLHRCLAHAMVVPLVDLDPVHIEFRGNHSSLWRGPC